MQAKRHSLLSPPVPLSGSWSSKAVWPSQKAPEVPALTSLLSPLHTPLSLHPAPHLCVPCTWKTNSKGCTKQAPKPLASGEVGQGRLGAERVGPWLYCSPLGRPGRLPGSRPTALAPPGSRHLPSHVSSGVSPILLVPLTLPG